MKPSVYQRVSFCVGKAIPTVKALATVDENNNPEITAVNNPNVFKNEFKIFINELS